MPIVKFLVSEPLLRGLFRFDGMGEVVGARMEEEGLVVHFDVDMPAAPGDAVSMRPHYSRVAVMPDPDPCVITGMTWIHEDGTETHEEYE